jgi:predicted amino acid racemase
MDGPRVTIRLDAIERNARTVTERCREAGIEVFGVTKGACGMPQVARAMLRGGVAGLAESRFENIRRLRDSGIEAPVMLLRSPPLARIEETIRSVDVSLNSELPVLRELSRVAERMGRVHDVILMVDLGDLREGIWPSDLMAVAEEVMDLPGIRLSGLGTNLTCFGAIIPTEKNLGELVAHARAIEDRFGTGLKYVSCGNSSSLPLLLAGRMPEGVNNLRIGEAILKGGRDTFLEEPWEALDRDAFHLTVELLEVKVKPSVPIGEMGVDAFGQRPTFEDRGERLRGIGNVGREDVIAEGLEPVRPGIAVLGASSDHLVLDLTDARPEPKVGEHLDFRMSYGAMLAAMTSDYVEKLPMHDQPLAKAAKAVDLIVEEGLEPSLAGETLESRIAALGLTTNVLTMKAPRDQVAASLGRGALPVLFGRDHGVSWAGLEGAAQALDAFGLLWLDATAAFLPVEEREGFGPRSVLYRALGHGSCHPGLTSRLSPENVAIIGLRHAEALEAEALKASRATVFTMVDIDALGVREVMKEALKVATAGTRGYYVSYSPSVTDIPGTVEGSAGMTIRETHQAMEMIAANGGLLSIDLVGLAPATEPRIRQEACHFLLSALGKRIL